MKRLLIVSALVVITAGCSFAAGRNIRAYNACLARHPQDSVLCDAPLQAYDLDHAVPQVTAAVGIR